MLDIFTIILAVIGTAAVAFLIYVALQPSEFRIERTAEIGAPADKIFPLINDLRQFNTWNPFAKADPTSAITYSGPAHGVGAAYDWSGSKAGAGRMQIATSIPSSKVTANLDFLKPFAANNIAEFTLVPRGGSTAGGISRAPGAKSSTASGSPGSTCSASGTPSARRSPSVVPATRRSWL